MLRPLTPPAREPVTLAEARVQCRVHADDTSEDARLAGYIAAARGMAEQETGRRLITQTWQLVLDAFPAGDSPIQLVQTPALAVTALAYTDATGTAQTLDVNTLRLDVRDVFALLRPAYGSSWPTSVRADVGVVTVTYTAGFGPLPGDVPQEIREWILAHVAAMWEQRSAVSEVGNNVAALPYVARLLDPWRVYA